MRRDGLGIGLLAAAIAVAVAVAVARNIAVTVARMMIEQGGQHGMQGRLIADVGSDAGRGAAQSIPGDDHGAAIRAAVEALPEMKHSLLDGVHEAIDGFIVGDE